MRLMNGLRSRGQYLKVFLDTFQNSFLIVSFDCDQRPTDKNLISFKSFCIKHKNHVVAPH